MKHLLLILPFLLLPTLADAQTDYRQSIRDTFAVYRDLTIAKKYDRIMDYIYPKLFELVGREQLVELFRGLDDESMSISFVDLRIDSISERFVQGDEQFVLVYHGGTMTVRPGAEMAADTASLSLLRSVYEQQYGTENVRLSQSKAAAPTLTIQLKKTLFAIAPTDSRRWRFLENNRDNPALLEFLLPKAVINRFAEN